eukprot:20128-Eustigmatos_ZCMA.PRE.1
MPAGRDNTHGTVMRYHELVLEFLQLFLEYCRAHVLLLYGDQLVTCSGTRQCSHGLRCPSPTPRAS